MNALTNLDLISFSDCPVQTMSVDTSTRQIEVLFDYLYTNTNDQWEAVDDLMLTLSNWNELSVEVFRDDNWTLLESDRVETFKEIHEFKRQRNQLIIEGFSFQSGYWLRYNLTGNLMHLTTDTRKIV